MAEQNMPPKDVQEQDMDEQPESQDVLDTDAHALSNTDVKNSPAYQELYNQHLRLAADFENFRKRQAQERQHLFKYGASTTLEAILPVLDNLERGLQSLSKDSDSEMLFKSFDMMSTQLMDALQSVGLSRMSPVGDQFDPEQHEAISQVAVADQPENSVVEVYKDGYLLHDKVLRPAQVIVASAPASAETSEGEAEPSSNPFMNANLEQGKQAE